MFLKKIYIENFRVLKDIEIQFEKEFTPTIYPLGSLNGGGKSTLLQLIFILLHCSFQKEKHEYLFNILSTLKFSPDTITTLAKFDICYENQDFYLEFIVSYNYYDRENFNIFLEVEKLEAQLEDLSRLDANYSSLLELHSEINSWNNRTQLDWQRILPYINTRQDNDLYQIAKEKGTLDAYKDCVSKLITLNAHNIMSQQGLHQKYEAKKTQLLKKIEDLKSKDLLYITHFDNDKILLCKTKLDDTDILHKMSDQVYLAAPITQVFLFLSKQEKQVLFSRENGITNYINNLNQTKEKLTGFFPYDFASTDLIIKSFEKARDKDFEDALENGKYGDHLKKLTTELNNFFDDKTITVNKELSNIVFKFKNDNEKLLPEDLSHGELKKLGIYIWLKYYAIEDSLVLMDEIEIGLHPDWQYEIVNELQEWGKNNQFILATHSYELCQALTPSHVKELEPKLIKTA